MSYGNDSKEKEKRGPLPVILDCGHTVYFRQPLPHVGDMIYCARHQMWFKVKGGNDVKERPHFRVKCRDCRFTRKFNTPVYHARVTAETHSIRMGHEVVIMNKEDKTLLVIRP